MGEHDELGMCVRSQQGFFLSDYVDDINLEGKKQNLFSWKMKNVIDDERSSFLDHVPGMHIA